MHALRNLESSEHGALLFCIPGAASHHHLPTVDPGSSSDEKALGRIDIAPQASFPDERKGLQAKGIKQTLEQHTNQKVRHMHRRRCLVVVTNG